MPSRNLLPTFGRRFAVVLATLSFATPVYAQQGTCTDPLPVETAPSFTPGDTGASGSNYWIVPGTCPQVNWMAGLHTPENVHQYTAEQAGTYRYTVTANFDTVLYVLSECAQPEPVNCLAAEDQWFIAPESVLVSLDAHQTVYVVVDGYYQTGPYELTVSGNIGDDCVPPIFSANPAHRHNAIREVARILRNPGWDDATGQFNDRFTNSETLPRQSMKYLGMAVGDIDGDLAPEIVVSGAGQYHIYDDR